MTDPTDIRVRITTRAKADRRLWLATRMDGGRQTWIRLDDELEVEVTAEERE